MKLNESKKILLVDDDVIIAMSEQMELERRDYSVVLAHSGEESIYVFNNTPDIDLILMDIDLGNGLDGTEAAELILKIRELPILFMSSHTEPEIVEKTERITSYGYIAKNSTTSVIDASIKMAFKLFDAHQKLQKSEKRYESILENRGTATATVNKNGWFISCNSNFEELTGFSKEELTDKKNYAEIQNKHIHKIITPILSNNHAQFESRLTNTKGEQKFVTINTSAFDDEIVISINDITNEKKAKLALEASEEYYRSLIENVVDVIALINAEGYLTYVTPSQENVLGYKPKDLTGKNVFKYIHKDDLKMVLNNFKELLENPGHIIKNSFRFKHKDGGWRYIEGTGKSLVNSPYVKGVVINYHDITDRIKAETILKESEERYRTLFNNGTDLTIISEMKPTGLPGKIIDVNDNAIKYLGYSREELLKMSPLDFAAAPEMKQYLPLAKEFLKSKHITFNTSGYTKSGKPIDVEIKSGIIKYNNKPLMINSVRDITEKKARETALQKSEKKFRSIINQAKIGITLVDSSGIIREWNSYKEKLTGIKYKNAINRPLFEVVKNIRTEQEDGLSNKTRSFILNKIATLNPKDDTKESSIIHYKNKDGSLITIEHSYFAVDIDGEIMYASFDQDITEKVRAEEALKASEEKYRRLVETTSDGFWLLNKDNKIIDVNQAFCAMVGYSKDESLGRLPCYFVPQKGCDFFKKTLSEVKEGIHKQLEVLFNTKEGQQTPALVSLSPLMDKSNHPIGTFAFIKNISELASTKAALQTSKEQFQSIFNNATIGLYRTTPDGQILMANPTLIKMLGYHSIDELTARNLNQDGFEAGYSRKTFLDIINKHGDINGLESIWKDKNGKDICIRESAVAIYNEKGKILYYEGSVEDITKRKEAEEAVSKLLGEKEMLLREVHHRIKNNMAVIQSLLRMQSNKVKSEEAKTNLTDAMARVESMQTLYDKLYRSKAYQSVSIKSYLSQLTQEIIQMFPLKKNIKMELQIEDFLVKPDIMFPLGIILNELLTNSMKYAFNNQPEPTIMISVITTESNTIFTYSDNGPGLPQSNLYNMKGFGLKLINTLVKQLQGIYAIDNQNGAEITIQISNKT